MYCESLMQKCHFCHAYLLAVPISIQPYYHSPTDLDLSTLSTTESHTYKLSEFRMFPVLRIYIRIPSSRTDSQLGSNSAYENKSSFSPRRITFNLQYPGFKPSTADT